MYYSYRLINYEKSALFSAKKSPQRRRPEVLEVLNVQEIDRHERYLGLPTFIGQNNCHAFRAVKERVWKQLQGWQEKLFIQSREGDIDKSDSTMNSMLHYVSFQAASEVVWWIECANGMILVVTGWWNTINILAVMGKFM